MIKNKSKPLALLFLVLFFASFSHAQSYTKGKRLTYKGRSYSTVVMGNGQKWMAENLRVFYFRNGDPIPVVKTYEAWLEARENKQPACCYYANNAKYGKTYGLLYNWYAVTDPRGLAPKGWHVPSDKEWTILMDHIGGKPTAGAKMKSTSGWKDGGERGKGTNESGFSGLPGGLRIIIGMFLDVGSFGCWWSSTENSRQSAWCRSLGYNSGDAYRRDYYKAVGLSVRCLRD